MERVYSSYTHCYTHREGQVTTRGEKATQQLYRGGKWHFAISNATRI